MFDRVFFVGAFNPIEKLKEEGSFAGAKVQLEIIRCLRSIYPAVDAFAMQETRTWPFNRMFLRRSKCCNVIHPMLINVKYIKSIVYAIQIFLFAIKKKPQVFFQYNSSLVLNAVSFLLKLFGVKTVLILQDINCDSNLRFSYFLYPAKLSEFCGLKLARGAFDIIIPVSDAIISEFKFRDSNTIVWPGGVIGEIKQTIIPSVQTTGLDVPFAVAAGTLSEYNGVYLLAKQWCDQKIPYVLHVFGDGVECSKIKELSKKYSNVEYHGRTSPELVQQYLHQSTFNFCLRYSIGIDERFFFPSKFFDILTLHGAVLVNDFYGLPLKAKNDLYILNDDLSNLSHLVLEIISEHSEENYLSRIKIANTYFSWLCFFNKLHRRLNCDSCS